MLLLLEFTFGAMACHKHILTPSPVCTPFLQGNICHSSSAEFIFPLCSHLIVYSWVLCAGSTSYVS